MLWEMFLGKHTRICTIIELGTHYGGMSLFLLLQAKQRSMRFWTYDITTYTELSTPVQVLAGLRSCFRRGDLFGSRGGHIQSVLQDRSLHPLILFCDNGDKRKEWNNFVPYLINGDYVAVHDWGDEFSPLDVNPFHGRLEPVLWDDCEQLGSFTRFWRFTEL